MQKGHALSLSKGFGTVYILLGILVLGLVAGGAYYLGKSNSTQPTPAPFYPPPSSTPPTPQDKNSISPDQTANWKTYKENSIQFQYPWDWKLSINNGTTDSFISLEPPVKKSDMGDNISIDIHTNPKNLSIAEFVGSRVGGGPYHFQQIQINGIQAEKSLDVPEATNIKRIYMKHNSNIYELFVQSDANNYIATFNQILSTFKFTN